MSNLLVVGVTHYPPLARGPEAMLANLAWALTEPTLPAELRAASGWPEAMQAEYGSDEGLAAAQQHEVALRAGFSRARAELDAFDPDVVIIWGDDQYEQFREDVVPAFCVYALDEATPFGAEVSVRPFAVELIGALLADDFDVSYSYRFRDDRPIPHAFRLTVEYLAGDGTFPYPVLPISLNCYGSSVVSRKGSRTHVSALNGGAPPDPPAPTPRRCMAFGASIAQFAAASGQRVALISSSSWSHAFLNDKAWHLHPDMEADGRLYHALVDQRWDTWESLTTSDAESAGQQEILNWSCGAGAIREAGLTLAWSDFIPTWLCNSNKVFAAFA